MPKNNIKFISQSHDLPSSAERFLRLSIGNTVQSYGKCYQLTNSRILLGNLFFFSIAISFFSSRLMSDSISLSVIAARILTFSLICYLALNRYVFLFSIFYLLLIFSPNK